MRLIYKGVVHPWLCDAMGHLTTRHYLGMFDDASYHLLAEVLGWAPGAKGWEGKGWADIRQEIDYREELSAGSLIEIEGAVAGIGNSSVTTRYEMKNKTTGAVVASLRSKSVYFDLQARKAVTLTPAMRERLQAALET